MCLVGRQLTQLTTPSLPYDETALLQEHPYMAMGSTVSFRSAGVWGGPLSEYNFSARSTYISREYVFGAGQGSLVILTRC